MSVIALDSLIDQRRLWRGSQAGEPVAQQPTGHAALDAGLPAGGWPESALSEILLGEEGSGELRLLWPTLARLTRSGARVVLVAPPQLPYPRAWQAAGVDLDGLLLVAAQGTEVLWAAEQCLRSGVCAAVLCWPRNADDRALRRLQVAAENGRSLGFIFRPRQAASNPSPAALRLQLETRPLPQLRVLKCRGGLPPSAAIAWAG